jgi:hypothetical protein
MERWNDGTMKQRATPQTGETGPFGRGGVRLRQFDRETSPCQAALLLALTLFVLCHFHLL